MAAIEVEGLTKSYGDRPVLTGLDLQVQPGEVLALLGPNGAGKTTLITILSTLARPRCGRGADRRIRRGPAAGPGPARDQPDRAARRGR